MVLSARIQHLRESALAGADLSIHFSMNRSLGTGKVKIITHGLSTCPIAVSIDRGLVVAALDLLFVYAADDKYTITDRCHKHSCGFSEVCFWSRPRRTVNPGTLNAKAERSLFRHPPILVNKTHLRHFVLNLRNEPRTY